jgi:hypothetical protein
MRNIRRLNLLIIIVAVAVPVWSSADKRQRIDSRWRDREVVIDGDDRDWTGPLLRVDEKLPITAGAVNDGQFLYVVLSTSEPAKRAQILRDGLIVWFDPAGGESKHFGVKFPVGMRPEMRGRRSAGPDPSRSPDKVEPTNRLEVFGPKKDDARSLVADMAPGIAVKVGNVEGSLVYELKVPIQKSAELPYAIEAKPGALIGFGLETLKPEAEPREEGGRGAGMGGRGRGRGMGGGPGGMGGMGGGRRGERGPEPVNPLKIWATIQLARA